jgi:hypothetical protein
MTENFIPPYESLKTAQQQLGLIICQGLPGSTLDLDFSFVCSSTLVLDRSFVCSFCCFGCCRPSWQERAGVSAFLEVAGHETRSSGLT